MANFAAFPNLAPATFAYYVTNVRSHQSKPNWQYIRSRVESDINFDEPLTSAAGIFFTTSFYRRNADGSGELPGFSVYPRRRSQSGVRFWRVKLPLAHFSNCEISRGFEQDGQVLLLLTSNDDETAEIRRHPDVSALDANGNGYLCRNQGQWYANVFQEDGNFVNFMVPKQCFPLSDPGIECDIVDQIGRSPASLRRNRHRWDSF